MQLNCRMFFALHNVKPCEEEFACSRNGRCIPHGPFNTTAQCKCNAGFIGQKCEFRLPPQPATNTDCLNGGACLTTGSGGGGSNCSCICLPGFQGSKCETKILHVSIPFPSHIVVKLTPPCSLEILFDFF